MEFIWSPAGSVSLIGRVSVAIAALLASRVALGDTDPLQLPVILDPASPPAESIRDLFLLVLAITSVIFFLVAGALLVFVIRFRNKHTSAETEPPQIYGSMPIELAWTVAPLLIVVVLGLVVIRSLIEIKAEPSRPGEVKIRVTGHQWWWEFEYPKWGVITANEMVIPVGTDGQQRPIHLKLESADVIHSFWVPRLSGKTDLIPNHVNEMRFRTSLKNTYLGQCAEYCGTEHAKMLLRVEARTEDDFQKWIDIQQKPAVENPEVAAGRKKFLSLACANCHTISGTPAVGTFGPNLTHLMSRQTLAAGIIKNTPKNLLRWVHDPQVIKEGCRMPDMHLSQAEAQVIVDYLLTLK